LASSNYHSKPILQFNRAFLEAVLAYTQSKSVNIISHSMGVTIARKIVKGGSGQDALHGDYNLGLPLNNKVNVFIGMAGGNEGLAGCYATPELPTCGITNGFFPG
jgi:hypothetical protein